MVILTPLDVDYYRLSLFNLRSALGRILFVNFLKANNATPRYFKTAEEYEDFTDKNKENNDCLFYACLLIFCFEINSILQSLKLTLIKLLRNQLMAYRRARLQRIQKHRAQAAFEDTELEEQLHLQKEQEILAMLMSTPEFLSTSHQASLTLEQQHFYAMQNSTMKTLTRHTIANEKYQKITTKLDNEKANPTSTIALCY